MATLSSADAAHFLRRVGFGGTTAEIEALTGLEREAVVDAALDFSGAPEVVAPTDLGQDNQWWAHSNAVDWWLHRMATTTHPLQEKLALFWHNHLCSGQGAVSWMPDMFAQNQLFRPAGPGNPGGLGLGDFGDLVYQVSIGGAMLVYLNNDTNVKGREQENFARELMELFTVGVGHYTEADVVNMAKAWTGHNVVGWNGSRYDATYLFKPSKHDDSTKSLFGGAPSSLYGVQPRNWDAAETVDELVNGLKRADTARFVARKMYRAFIHDSPSDTAVQQLATSWINADMHIGALVRATLLHDDFWAPAARYALVRSPVEWMAAGLKFTGYRFKPNSAEGRNFIAGMGQLPFEPPNVAGWGINGYWLSTATAWARGRFASWIRWKVREGQGLPDLLLNLQTAGNGRVPLTPGQAIDEVFALLGITDASPATRSRLEAWYSTANTSGNGWSIRTNALMLGLLTPDFQLS